jgi:hypothetical protein
MTKKAIASPLRIRPTQIEVVLEDLFAGVEYSTGVFISFSF